MRIGIDIRSLLESYPSGVSEYTYQIIKHCTALDGNNTYLLFCNSSHGLSERYRRALQGDGVRIIEHHIPNKALNAGLFFLRYPKLDQWLGGVDLFFLPNFNFISLSPRCKNVLMVHDLSFRYPDFYPWRGRWWHRAIRPGQLIREADQIICPSASTKGDIVRWYGVAADRITVIPLAVDVALFQQHNTIQAATVREKYRLHKPFVLFLGTVEIRKNIHGVLAAWEKMQVEHHLDFELVVVGALKNKKIAAWRHPQVRFLDYVPSEDKPALYQLASIFVYPSFYEGFGLPVLEAMAAGLPVITSFSTSLPEVADSAALLVDPYSVTELSQALYQLCTQETLRQELIARGLQRVRAYSWQKTAAATVAVFNNVYA